MEREAREILVDYSKRRCGHFDQDFFDYLQKEYDKLDTEEKRQKLATSLEADTDYEQPPRDLDYLKGMGEEEKRAHLAYELYCDRNYWSDWSPGSDFVCCEDCPDYDTVTPDEEIIYYVDIGGVVVRIFDHLGGCKGPDPIFDSHKDGCYIKKPCLQCGQKKLEKWVECVKGW
jgi:hypothetical protein